MKEVVEELKNLNVNIVKILEALKSQQRSKFEQIVEMTCAIASIFGIITIIDIIINWITGG